MKRLYTLVFALMVLLSITMSVEALEYKTMTRQSGMAAYADWTDTKGDISTYTDLFVTKTDYGTDIGVSICTDDTTTGDWSCKSGYVFTQENDFSIDNKLDSASLNAVEINLIEWYCDENGCWETPAGTITIQANWKGIGKITKSSSRYMSKYEDYMMKFSDSSTNRVATATGSTNNGYLGTSDFASLVKFKFASIDMKK
jgi:hypothetical protein